MFKIYGFVFEFGIFHKPEKPNQSIYFSIKKKYKSIKYNLDHINEFEILLNLKYLQKKKKIQTLKCKIWALIIELKFTRWWKRMKKVLVLKERLQEIVKDIYGGAFFWSEIYFFYYILILTGSL